MTDEELQRMREEEMEGFRQQHEVGSELMDNVSTSSSKRPKKKKEKKKKKSKDKGSSRANSPMPTPEGGGGDRSGPRSTGRSLLEQDEQNEEWNQNRQSIRDPDDQQEFFADFQRQASFSNANGSQAGSQYMSKPVQAHVDMDDAQSFAGFIIDNGQKNQDMASFHKEQRQGGSGASTRDRSGRDESGSRRPKSANSHPLPATEATTYYDEYGNAVHGVPHDMEQGGHPQHQQYHQNGYPPEQSPRHHPHHQQPQGQYHDNYDDGGSVHSDITGLTGAFSNLHSVYGKNSHHHQQQIMVEEDLTDEDQNYDDPNYPKYDPMSYLQARASAKQHRGSSQPMKVRFASVEVRYYQRIIGDNPSTVSGPPISIGWKYRQESPLSLDEWEQREHSIKGFLKSSQMILSRDEREKILLGLGYSKKDIATAIRNGIKDKNRRRQTVQNLQSSSMEESMESLKGGVKRIFGLKRR